MTPEEICAKCQGQCCKSLPGAVFPEQFGLPTADRLQAVLASNIRTGFTVFTACMPKLTKSGKVWPMATEVQYPATVRMMIGEITEYRCRACRQRYITEADRHHHASPIGYISDFCNGYIKGEDATEEVCNDRIAKNN